MNKVIIGIGSNINPEENVELALEKIKNEFKILKSSEFIETKPVGFESKNNFINGVILIETTDTYSELKQKLKKIEKKLGRKKTSGEVLSRTIDLDILIWNNEIVDKDIYKLTFFQKLVKSILPQIKF